MKRDYLFIIAALIFCLFIYLFYRSEKTIINEISIQLFSLDSFRTIKTAVRDIFPLNNSIIYSLPGGLWVFCITATSKKFYITLFSRKIYCAFIPIIFSIGLELLQLYGVTNGTFDFMDIIMSIGFWVLAMTTFKNDPDRQDILKPINMDRAFCITTYAIVYLAHVSP